MGRKEALGGGVEGEIELRGVKRLAIVTFFRGTHIRVYPDGHEERRDTDRVRANRA